MTEKTPTANRRTILFGAGVAASLPLLAVSGQAQAAGTVPQASAKYQNMPKGAYHCGLCTYFIPGATATGPGNCKVVAGSISPNGWCQLFAAKHA